MRILYSILLLCFLVSCAESKLSGLDVLVGTWKIQAKHQYEVWEKSKNDELIGYSFKIDSSERTLTETLLIREFSNNIIYEATVPDQNDGETVQFILNTEINAYFSFENDLHDFPKKIPTLLALFGSGMRT